MNENIDLTKILKDCPRGWKLYSSIYGIVHFWGISPGCTYPIIFTSRGINTDGYEAVTKRGLSHVNYAGECTLFPSKDQRDWRKFTSPWYNNEKFDPKTLKPFDKVLTRNSGNEEWTCTLFSYRRNDHYPFICSNEAFLYCIPYNDDTKHLIGTKEEIPEYYKYWEG